jgi:hypothetical protein
MVKIINTPKFPQVRPTSYVPVNKTPEQLKADYLTTRQGFEFMLNKTYPCN